MERKKILILCDCFPPFLAPRMGYLCKYLPELGWEPIIITELMPQSLSKELSNSNNITYINYYLSDNKITQKIKYTFVFLADFFFNYKDIIVAKKIRQHAKIHNFSLILSSTYRTYPLRAAYKASKKYNLPLVTDLRDIIEQFPKNEHISKKISNIDFLNNLVSFFFTKRLLHQRNFALRYANYITTISPWHVETLKKYNKNTHLIYNGFDSELFYPENIKSSKFTIIYTGRIWSLELRDPSLLFEATSKLLNEKKIDAKNFQIHFYIDENSINLMKNLSQKFNIAPLVYYFNYIPYTQIRNILNQSSILLLLTNKSTTPDGPKGIMTTKFFEYLAVEKPILCVRSDEGCLENVINDVKCGLAGKNVEEVAGFIEEKYNEWKQNGYTSISIDKDKIQQFSRKYQAKQFVEIFESLINKNE